MKSTALLVDDDPIDIKPLRMILQSWDLDVITASSGEKALEQLKNVPTDIVVSDVRMPGMSGEDVVREVARQYPGLPVVLITGKGDLRSAVNAVKLGAFDYVLKPPEEAELRLIVERALEHSRLRHENEFLRAELAVGGMYGERLIGRSPEMETVFQMINRVARTDSTVLITGETGTGKEMVAQTIHYKSKRANRPFVALNCASINPNLTESELFGHEKGAFTGAATTRRSRFEDADGGTLFLDEITETSLEFQAKLLRVLQEGEFERVGGNRKIKVDVRILTSTNRDLEAEVAANRFRPDLFYRLRVIPINLPALRDRRDDIPLLATHFAIRYGKRYRNGPCEIAPQAMKQLIALDWKGNVRELQHQIERAVVLADGQVLQPADFETPEKHPQKPDQSLTLESFVDKSTRLHLISVLDQTGWHKQRAAELLGIDRVTLYRLLKKYSIRR